MRRRPATALALLLCSAVVAACGGDDEGEPIPQDLASPMEQQLENIRGQIENGSLGACQDILSPEPDATLATLERLAQQVPGRVDPDIRDSLDQSIDNLRQLVRQECDRLAEEEQQEVEEEPVEPAPVPEETIPEEEPPPETVPPEDEDEGEGDEGEGEGSPEQGGTRPGQGGGNSGGIVVPEGDG